MLAIDNDVFDPVLLSVEETAFVLEHVGKPPAVVARVKMPLGVNPRTVLPVIEQVYALEEVAKHDKEPWVGVEAVKDRCRIYLEQQAIWQELKAKHKGNPSWPTFPTMAGWDSRGKPALGATGSDAGRVRTYFDANGDRKPFALHLHGDDGPAFQVPWLKTTPVFDKLLTDDAKGFVRCPICEHTEKYNVDAPSDRNAAYARMARHLSSAKEQIEAHRELHTKVYGR
jgi:hypothetical protein